MQRAFDRRQTMLELLSDRRQETVANLRAEFGVSCSTVLRDIETLSCSAPIFTVQGNGGGVRVADGYYYNILRSMSKVGTPTDNAIVEVINGWIKEELFLDFGLATTKDVPKLLDEYVHSS